MGWLKHILCPNHDYHRKWDASRVWLECFNCGKQTPGWEIDEKFRDNLVTNRRTREQDKKDANVREMQRWWRA